MAEITQPVEQLSRRERDMQLFHEWKNTGSKQALGKLINQLSPVIYHEVRNQSGTLPTPALSAEAKKWTLRALQTYDPEKGVLLSTHVSNYLPKIRRMNAKFVNAVRLPENLHYQFNTFNKSLQDLTDELGREPNDDELSKHLNWTKPQVVKFKGMLFADLLESNSARPSEFTRFNDQTVILDHIKSQLTPQERVIFDNKGYLSSTELAEKLGINLNRLNYLTSKMVDKIREIQLETGMGAA
jgi:DNA-directed RNA polymerase specialized sigma subunit